MSLRDRFRNANSRTENTKNEDRESSVATGDGNGKGNGKSVASALNCSSYVCQVAAVRSLVAPAEIQPSSAE